MKKESIVESMIFKPQKKTDKGSEKTPTIAPTPKPTPSPQKKEEEDEDRDAGLFLGLRGH